MAVITVLVSLLESFFKQIVFVFVKNFLAGFRDSLYGFFYVHKLENTSPFGPPRKPEPTVKKAKVATVTTVLHLRRSKEQKTDARPKQPKVEEIERKKASGLKLVLQCIGVNLASTLSLYFVVIPVLQWVYGILDTEWPEESWLFYVRKCILLVANVICCSFYIPLFLFIKVFNGIWCLDVSNAALRYAGVRSTKHQSFAYGMGDMVVGLLVESLFMIQSWMVTWIDFRVALVTHLINFVHLSLLYALFSFEYVWMAKGIKVTARLGMIERNWPYYLGFGALLAVTSIVWPGFILSYLIFGMFFPFFIISAYVTDDEKRYPQGSIPSLHIFWPCLLLANRIPEVVANAVNRCFAK